MIFNQKYSVMESTVPFYIFDREITEVSKYKYLGIIFSNGKHMYTENIVNLKNKALRAIGDIRANIGKILGANKPYNILIKLFDSQILPILEYGSEIWFSEKNMPHFETIHLSYLKYALGVKTQTSNLALYGETGRFPLVMRQHDKAIKLWLRLKFSHEKKPINHIFDELVLLQNSGYGTWLDKIRNLLGESYLQIPPYKNLKQLASTLKEIRYKRFIDDFFANIKNPLLNPKLRTYCLFKLDYRQEPYLYHVHSRNFLTAISRFRTSSHCLHIETGRHTIPYTPIASRLCRYCEAQAIDDEMHMLLECAFHEGERLILIQSLQPYLSQDFTLSIRQDLFTEIMKLKGSQALGKFFYTGFYRRSNLQI